MNLFKGLISFITVALLYSCSFVTPAFVTIQPNAKGIQFVSFDQNFTSVESLSYSYRFLKAKNVVLPNNDIITLRVVPSSPDPWLAGNKIMLEKYDANLKRVWSVMIDSLPKGEYIYMTQYANTVRLITLTTITRGASLQVFGNELTAQSSANFGSRTFDIITGAEIENKELFSDDQWSNTSDLTIKSSHNGAKILIHTFNQNKPNGTLRIFDEKFNLTGNFEIVNMANIDNVDLQREITVSDEGVVIITDKYKNYLKLSSYNSQNSQILQELAINIQSALLEKNSYIIQSAVTNLESEDLAHIIVQYGDGDETVGVAILDVNFKSKSSTLKSNLPFKKELVQKMIGEDEFEEFYINRVYFLPNEEYIVILEKKWEIDFMQTRVGDDVSRGKAPVYETVVALKFNKSGEIQWNHAFDRRKSFGSPTRNSLSRMVYVYKTDETSTLTYVDDRSLYVSYRDRNHDSQNGFTIAKISLDKGELSVFNLPFAMSNIGFGVFFLRDKTLWTPDGKLILFTKEALDENTSGKMIKVDLNQLY